MASLTLIVLSGALAAAQSAPPSGFEVASIRRSLLGAGGVGWGYQPGGRFVMRRQAVSVMIRQAYAEATDLLGAPDWVTSDAYDVEAKAEGNPPRDEMRLMLRSLLSERFRLKAHYETHESPVYALVLARADRPPAGALVRSTIDCEAFGAALREGRKLDVPNPANGAAPCAWTSSEGPDGVIVRVGGLPLARLGEVISSAAGRVVIDKTGLSGGYEFTLTFNPQLTSDSDLPSLFTAIEEQLGLKLVPDRAPLQVLVIDHIERPIEN